MIVMKFGGSSVADADRIRGVAQIVRDRMQRDPIVVVSALGGVTDLLESAFGAACDGELETLEPLLAEIERIHRWALAGCVDDGRSRHHLGLEIDRLFEQLRRHLRSVRILGEGTPRARDAVLAHGEMLSARIVAAAFRECELPAHHLEPETIMATDGTFGRASPRLAEVHERCREHLLPVVARRELPVLGGFVGSNEQGETTTLGRGGSDTSAAVLGLVTGAEEIQIWTDVDGLMSADPRMVPGARTLGRVSFAEAAELALYGARVLHPDSIAPAVDRNIPVRVLNSMRPGHAGTLVVGERPESENESPVAVASKAGMGLARLLSRRLPMDPELPRRVLATCADLGIAPELFLVSATTVTVVAAEADRLSGLRTLSGMAEVEIAADRAITCVVGSGVGRATALRERVMGELARWNPEVIASGALKASVVAVLRCEALTPCVRAVHQRFFDGVEGS